MAELRRVPPGRAGRLWLRGRESTALRALDLLDRKLRILRTEQQRFQLMAADARTRWAQAASAADRWGIRAAALTGRDGFRWAAPGSPATLRIGWASVMGVTYPSTVDVDMPRREPWARSPGSSALDQAVETYRAALLAAAKDALAGAALRVIDAEVQAVRLRRTAVHDRWLPRLRDALHDLEARLEENERAETVRWRQVAGDEPR